ncbi:hypothetical protein B0H13DRAFT_2343226 [Mycena leptocephala]|nr:hypothetical protein B0H13DRAFT_2343226 [Mycena leptocephala]
MFSKAFSALLVTALAVSASPAASLEARQGCTKTYTVVSGDTCAAIESRTGVSDSQLHALNPSINSGCTNLQIGQVLCVGSGGGSPPGGGQSFNGRATYYDPNGGFGACGSPCRTMISLSHSERDTGMAVPIAERRLMFSVHQGRTIQVSVQDLCPGCQGADGIDLSEGAMRALDSNYINDGVISVVWSFA